MVRGIYPQSVAGGSAERVGGADGPAECCAGYCWVTGGAVSGFDQVRVSPTHPFTSLVTPGLVNLVYSSLGRSRCAVGASTTGPAASAPVADRSTWVSPFSEKLAISLGSSAFTACPALHPANAP